MADTLTWSEPRATGWATIEAREGEHATWRITPVPRDVTRISYDGVDPDGTIITGMTNQAYAETTDEALIVVDILRTGTDHLAPWREQLEAAGFVRTYPERPDDDTLSQLWNDRRKTGLYQITVREGGLQRDEISVHATYESNGATSWHNVCNVDGSPHPTRSYGDTRIRYGLPQGIDALKAGVAAAIAIRAARQARGGSFAVPLGGPTRKR